MDTWQAISTANAPSMCDHEAVWADSEMAVWGNVHLSQGGLYTP
jgi:hypothetical protein